MPGDLELALRVRADMREAVQGIGTLNRTLGDTARQGGAADAALAGATGSTRAFAAALDVLGREGEGALDGARDAAESVFGAMESALARFVTTGKVSFAGFVDSVVTDLARLATRRFITQPLANALFGALPGLFGGGAPEPLGFTGAAASGGDAFSRLQAGVGHEGAVAGQLGGVTRAVPPALFAEAERFHAGGVAGLRADEVPIIAERGETILPRGAAIVPPSVQITFENRGTPQREVSRELRLDPRGLIVTVVTDDLRRGGPIRQTMQRELGGGIR